jgi:predicted nucleic acid-binding protein
VAADKVVDTSALAAVVFAERSSAEAQKRLSGCNLHAPALLRFELANVCLRKIRAHPRGRDALLAQHRGSLALPIQHHPVDLTQAVELAERFNLTAYDASYLWLARALGCELVTLDKRLAKAAAQR